MIRVSALQARVRILVERSMRDDVNGWLVAAGPGISPAVDVGQNCKSRAVEGAGC